MKFRYSKSMLFLQIGLVLLYSAALILFFYSDDKGFRWIIKMTVTVLVFFTAFFSSYIGEYLNRYVEFHDNYVKFNSYRIAGKVRHINVKYEDILSLEATVIPIIGIYKISVKAKNVPWLIPVTWCISHHKEMYSHLCRHAQKNNPDVFIDERILKRLGKQGLV